MTVRGTLNADGLAIAQLSVDLLKHPRKIHALAALINTESGQTLAYCQGDGGVWSQETLERLTALCESMEQDLANRVFTSTEVRTAPTQPGNGAVLDGGLAEHLGDGLDAPSV